MRFERLPVWIKAGFLLATAFVLAWGAWMALRDTLCATDTKDWIVKRPIRGACFEFWLNRYQSLFSAMIAGAIALFVVRPVFKQLRAMNLQTAIGAKAVAEGLAELLESEIAAASAVETRFWYCFSILCDLDARDIETMTEADLDAAHAELDEVERHFPVISKNARRLVGEPEIQQLRRGALEAIWVHRRRLQTVMGRARVRIASAAAGSPRPVTEGWLSTVRDAEKSKAIADPLLVELISALNQRAAEQWAVVRSFEGYAREIEV